jgi:PTH1 family peptidyl-tRNA hydrolase
VANIREKEKLMIKKLIVGLGNPGKSYSLSRHNAGAAWVEYWAGLYHFPRWALVKKYQAKVSQSEIGGVALTLLLPQTFMNLSGKSVAAWVRFFHLEVAREILVVFDDLDLELGQYKLGKSLPRQHNGVASVVECLGEKSFWSLRLGIDERAGARVIPPADYVLGNFSLAARGKLEGEVFPTVAKEIEEWLKK